ncbi:MAG: quinoprotein glucose dehydrogenase [Acidobacteria bacterium]|nr:MAG: quinoprotein glucose dehydrogenase [Acidobacteriota bacterium]
MRRTLGSWLLRLVPVVCLLPWVALPLVGQTGAPNGEWRTYGGDLGNTRYSPLDQISAANFKSLEVAWRFKTDNLGPRPEFNLEGTPLMANGVLYATAGTRRSVVALDPATGELLWVHGENEGPRGSNAPRLLSGRGLAYWTDGREERILYVTPGYRLIALNAKNGNPVGSFGVNGAVDLKQENDQEIDPITGEVGLHATPMIAKDIVVIGAAHRPGGIPRGKTNVKGYVRGYDVRTGKRLWIFHTIPRPGEFGNDTWEKDSWSYTGNTGVWGQMGIDEELGMVYLPIETPTGDFYGGNRPGAGLFGETLVAVDLRTGQRKWHFQFVHHGIWDWDMANPPIIADITVNGRAIKAIIQPTKQSWLYVFDRASGQPVWPIVERPVPKGDVPGEWYAPTQPFVTKPPAYDRQGVTIDDLIDFTPELRAQAVEFVKKYKIGPLFTPPVMSKAEGPIGTLMLPSAGGGSNWAGGSYDPEAHRLYIYSQTTPSSLGLVPAPPNNDFGLVAGNAAAAAARAAGAGRGDASQGAPAGRGAAPSAGGGPPAPGVVPSPATAAAAAAEGALGGGLNVQGLPLIKPPYGRITAFDMDKGEIAWQVAHGETPDNIRNHPALKGLNIPRTGQIGVIGTLVTRTLVIAGERQVTTTSQGRGAMLRAYNKTNGQEVGAVFMPSQQTGSPMTYMLNGKQYIVLAVGGGSFPGEYIAYRLPE